MDELDWMTNCHIDMMYRKRINISLNGCGWRLFRESATMIKVSGSDVDVRCTCYHGQGNWINLPQLDSRLDNCETLSKIHSFRLKVNLELCSKRPSPESWYARVSQRDPQCEGSVAHV